MAEWNADENPYEILGITLESTKDEQKKRYRKLVLEKHPDKQPGNKKAAEEFIKIQRAYEILSDDKAREAWDALQRAKSAREAKHAGQSAKRRKMAEDLERREKVYEAERTQERAARSKLQAELARLKREMAEREETRQAKLFQERLASNLAGAATHSAQADKQIQQTLKVSWDEGASTYTEEELQGIFSAHGTVEEVIPRPAKKKKGSALIVMADILAVSRATDCVNGRLDNPLLVMPLSKPGKANGVLQQQAAANLWASPQSSLPKAGYGTPVSQGAGAAPPKPIFAAFQARPATACTLTEPFQSTSNGSHSDFEEGIFAKMRRKAEQDRQAAQMPQK